MVYVVIYANEFEGMIHTECTLFKERIDAERRLRTYAKDVFEQLYACEVEDVTEQEEEELFGEFFTKNTTGDRFRYAKEDGSESFDVRILVEHVI